jgi:hypothetical protein
MAPGRRDLTHGGGHCWSQQTNAVGFLNIMRIYSTRRIGVAVMGNATRYDIDAVAALALG